MTWNSNFITSLDNPSKSIEFLLRFIGNSNDYFLGSGDNYSTHSLVSIGNANVVIDNARITPLRWSLNFGGFTIQLVGDLRILKNSSLRRGTIAELYMRRNRNIAQRVAIGQLRSVNGVRNVWTLEFGDLISALSARFSTKVGELQFYYNAGSKTTVTSNFNFSSSNQLHLSDITKFEKDSNFDGIAFVTNNSGNSVYYRWSSKTTTSAPAGYLTITSTGHWPSTTTIGTLNTGNEVVNIVRLQGRPDQVFARTLMSTGNATQGQFDDYPQSYGAGINWNPNLINSNDMDLWYNTVWKTATDNYHIQHLISAPESSGIRSLLNVFLQIGMWPVLRQGMISWRVCQDPSQAASTTISSRITDNHIINIISHEIYSTQQSVIFGKSSITTSSSGGVIATTSRNVSNVQALPANDEITRDNRLIYRIDAPAQSAKATIDIGRMSNWDLNTFETLTLAVQEKFAGLVAGDIVMISSNYIYGFNEASGKTYRAKKGMILGNRWLPSQSQCILTIGVIL